MTVQYVIARYNENIDWLKDDDKDILIYNKGKSLNLKNEIMLDNVGREAHTYLYHIINNYDNLKNIIVFSQANISDHTGLNDLHFFDKYIIDKLDFKFSSNYVHSNNEFCAPDFNIQIKNILVNNYNILENDVNKIIFKDWFIKNIQDDFPKNGLYIYWNALFCVSKNLILTRPKEFYINLYNQLVKLNAPIEGHFLERSWFYIFNCHKYI